MRTIGVVTVARSDYGIYRPVLRRIQADKRLRLHLIVAGAHLRAEFGRTIREIEADGFPVGARVDLLRGSDSPLAIAEAIGRGVAAYARCYARRRPDLLVVLGDRFEMYAAAVAALPFAIPIAHIHGGELTAGAMDDAIRHSMTKLSHLHFVSTREYARRVIQLGEEPWRVMVSGAPSLDNLRAMNLLSRGELERQFGVNVDPAPLLVTFHPVTLETGRTEDYTRELLAALETVALPVVFTAPNADTHGRRIRRLVARYVKANATARFVENLGTRGYFGLMAHARVMVGNSSSGILEAASFKLPVVNIGTRQEGRVRPRNVIDVGYGRHDIAGGIRRAISRSFRDSLADLCNPYDAGGAATTIVRRLIHVPIGNKLVMKRFHDL